MLYCLQAYKSNDTGIFEESVILEINGLSKYLVKTIMMSD